MHFQICTLPPHLSWPQSRPPLLTWTVPSSQFMRNWPIFIIIIIIIIIQEFHRDASLETKLQGRYSGYFVVHLCNIHFPTAYHRAQNRQAWSKLVQTATSSSGQAT